MNPTMQAVYDEVVKPTGYVVGGFAGGLFVPALMPSEVKGEEISKALNKGFGAGVIFCGTSLFLGAVFSKSFLSYIETTGNYEILAFFTPAATAISSWAIKHAVEFGSGVYQRVQSRKSELEKEVEDPNNPWDTKIPYKKLGIVSQSMGEMK